MPEQPLRPLPGDLALRQELSGDGVQGGAPQARRSAARPAIRRVIPAVAVAWVCVAGAGASTRPPFGVIRTAPRRRAEDVADDQVPGRVDRDPA